MDILCKHLSKIRIPTETQAIYKDECVYSFDSPETPTGLYVSLTSFLGFGEAYVKQYAEKSGNVVFLHIQRTKTLKNDANSKVTSKDDSGVPERKITRLAIGIEGGYNENDTSKYDIKDTYSVVIMPHVDVKLPYPDIDLPMVVVQSIEGILAIDSAIVKIEKDTLQGTWDGEVRRNTIFSEDLHQLDNGKKIPPSGWKCDKCDLTTNLWLNLTDGSILCGRRFFDGSGGNDHSVQHFKEFKYPLAVKLGTISAEGKPDVFSYAEDDMVVDTNLEKHLAHFGINMAAMKKSEKSMVELELEINQRIGEWSLLTESDSELQPLAGPGYTGMRNLGNSCYINSVMQVVFTVPDFVSRYVGDAAEKYFKEFLPNPANDFNVQMAKLGNGLWSGKYSSIAENSLDSESTGISPAMFKNVVGKNHPDFNSKSQQDACDFYLHLLNLLARNSRNQQNPGDALSVTFEERVECMASKKVRYTRRTEYCMPLGIPLDKAINLEEVREYLERKSTDVNAAKDDKNIVRHIVPLKSCLERFFAPELIEDFFSPAIKGSTTAMKVTRLVNMPDYLMLHLRKFTLGNDWVPKKLDVAVQMPDELDLSKWRATGLQSDEILMPETENETHLVGKFSFDESVMSELMQMGFPQEACKRAVFHTSNSGLEAASNWLMEHIGDADISEPFVVPMECPSAVKAKKSSYVANPESLGTLMSMGFNECQATKALKATNGNIERATDYIFSHMDEGDIEDIATGDQNLPIPENVENTSSRKKELRDGSGKYRLAAFISHMGTSAHVGHYVCHINKNGQWVIFNDSKVAVSQNPPKDLGYLYFYKRVD